jgi:hypothetical protein
VHHYGEIGAAVAHINDVVVADTEACADFFQHGDFAPAGGGSDDGVNFAGRFVVAEAGAEDAFGGDNAFQRRLDDFLWCGGYNVEMNVVAL